MAFILQQQQRLMLDFDSTDGLFVAIRQYHSFTVSMIIDMKNG